VVCNRRRGAWCIKVGLATAACALWKTLGIVLVCRSETSVEQLGIDCETAKAAQDTMEAVLGELACNHEVGGQRYNSAPIGTRSSRLEQHAYE
jgi:hypothetical protein